MRRGGGGRRGGEVECCVTGRAEQKQESVEVCVILMSVCRPVSRKRHEWKCRDVCHVLAEASDEGLADMRD